jgi:hypothetical protein
MDAHGYRLIGNEKTVSVETFPSLIGVDPFGNKARPDPYFDRVDITDRRITSLSISRWVTFDSAATPEQDPILEVRSPSGGYYIPRSELVEIAAANQDDETFEMLAVLKGRRVQ